MDQTYVLVDFENIQPQDMGLLSGEEYQLRIFRGPHQKKLDFDIVESLQPLGDRVKYLQSDRHGKNALDLHIAFYMGRLLQELEANASPENQATRFVVISHDGGFDALMAHVQSLGYVAMKAASIRQALGLVELVAKTGQAHQQMSVDDVDLTTQSPPNHSPISQPLSKPPVVKKAAPATKTPPVKSTAAPKKTAKPQAKPGKAMENKPEALVRQSLGPEDREKIIENLRQHPKNRPVKRKTLESHITSLLGGSVTSKAVRGLVAGLENEGVIKFSENKIVEYKIPKRKK
jgi:hypothetical protein